MCPAKIAIIKTPFECPHRSFEECTLVRHRYGCICNPQNDDTTFPNWCPLEDYNTTPKKTIINGNLEKKGGFNNPPTSERPDPPPPRNINKEIVTTPHFWECNCEKDFLHVSSSETNRYCELCGTCEEEGPDARVVDVEKYLNVKVK